ncbi:MAG: hypothetical protein KGL39_41055 [Patescibacteria group bacterium]|nr:hypothetical protein [Patescibacteria group bacterium]
MDVSSHLAEERERRINVICKFVREARLQVEPLDWEGVIAGVHAEYAFCWKNMPSEVIRAASPYSADVTKLLLVSGGRRLLDVEYFVSGLDCRNTFCSALYAITDDQYETCAKVLSLLDTDFTYKLFCYDGNQSAFYRGVKQHRGIGGNIWINIRDFLIGTDEAAHNFNFDLMRRNLHLHDAWWWMFDDIAIVADRPVMIQCDEQGKPHCDDGPAIRYADGWEVWMQHGVRVRPQSEKR